MLESLQEGCPHGAKWHHLSPGFLDEYLISANLGKGRTQPFLRNMTPRPVCFLVAAEHNKEVL